MIDLKYESELAIGYLFLHVETFINGLVYLKFLYPKFYIWPKISALVENLKWEFYEI